MLVVLVSVVLGIVPLLGIAWTVSNGTLFTVDGLFVTLILLTLSGIFFANAMMEVRRGLKDEQQPNSARKAS